MENLAIVIENIKNSECNPYYEIVKEAYNRGELFELLSGHVKYHYDQNGKEWLYYLITNKPTDIFFAIPKTAKRLILCGINIFYDSLPDEENKNAFKNELIESFKKVFVEDKCSYFFKILYSELFEETSVDESFIPFEEFAEVAKFEGEYDKNKEYVHKFSKAHLPCNTNKTFMWYSYSAKNDEFKFHRIKAIDKTRAQKKAFKNFYKKHGLKYKEFICPICGGNYIHDIETYEREEKMTPVKDDIYCEHCSKLTVAYNLCLNNYISDKPLKLIDKKERSDIDSLLIQKYNFNYSSIPWNEIEYLIQQQKKGLLMFYVPGSEQEESDIEEDDIVRNETVNIKDLECLIGAKLISLEEKQFTVLKENKEYVFSFNEDHGGCSGYNRIKTQLLIDTKEKPVITNIEVNKTQYITGAKCTLTLFGLNKTIAEVNTVSSSGSGWEYGAYVQIVCDPLCVCETLSKW